MIQAAHVGVGISGEEGLQAARCSDYAIAQFRFLQRLLLIHGRHSYRRITKLILYSFYKNITLYISQFWFTLLNGWSGQTFYERFTLTAYNIVWTLVPIVVLGIFDKDVDDNYVLEHPQLYRTGPSRYYFNFKVFWGWVFTAVWHSLVLYGMVGLAFDQSNVFPDGRSLDLFSMGTVSYTCVVITVNLKLALETRYWTWINHVAIWGSILAYIFWLLIYGLFYTATSVDVGADLFYVIYNLGTSALFYWSCIVIPVVCLWRDFTWKYLFRTFMPRSYHIVQEMQMLQMNQPKNLNGGSGLSFAGYSFASQESTEVIDM